MYSVCEQFVCTSVRSATITKLPAPPLPGTAWLCYAIFFIHIAIMSLFKTDRVAFSKNSKNDPGNSMTKKQKIVNEGKWYFNRGKICLQISLFKLYRSPWNSHQRAFFTADRQGMVLVVWLVLPSEKKKQNIKLNIFLFTSWFMQIVGQTWMVCYFYISLESSFIQFVGD